MKKPKTKLSDLTKRTLNNRITSAERRIYDMKEELARRERIARYGTETPELREFNVAVDATFWTTVKAKDEADAIAVLDGGEVDFLEWYSTMPGEPIQVDDYQIEWDDPVPVEVAEEWQRDAVERMKKEIEARKRIVGADGIAVTVH
jgi:hypothetical protein